ncbi:MAG TPA: tyrosine-protein phosphatase [Pseudonocardiaceae bacterium]
MVLATDPRSSLVNFRDVGGLPTDDGRLVPHGVLYRSEAPQEGDAAPEGIAPWPVSTVIDLRSEAELFQPHPFRTAGSRVHHMPLDPALAPDAVARIEAADDGLVPLYRHLLKVTAEQIAEIATIVANCDGPVLIHCAAGKDRTGMVVGILLRAVDVSRAAILTDYLRTNDRLPDLLVRLRRAGLTLPPESALLGVSADAITAVLDEVDSERGGAAAWLRSAGTDAQTIDRLRARLVA